MKHNQKAISLHRKDIAFDFYTPREAAKLARSAAFDGGEMQENFSMIFYNVLFPLSYTFPPHTDGEGLSVRDRQDSC